MVADDVLCNTAAGGQKHLCRRSVMNSLVMLKDSSLVSVIGFEELTRRGQLIIAQTYGSFEIWTTVAILYLIMTLAISRVVAALEKR